MTRYIVLSLTVYHRDGLDRWCVWLTYCRGIGEVIASGINHEPEPWHWAAEPVRSAA